MPSQKDEIAIELFNGDQAVADEIANLHLQIRLGQREEGTNDFRPDVTPIHDSQADLKAIQDYYVEPGGNFWIARDIVTNQVAGFVGLKRQAEDVGALKRMAVLKEYRRQGVGLELVKTLIGWARENGFKTIELGTAVTENAHDLYLKLGFVDVGKGKDGADYLMRLDLGK